MTSIGSADWLAPFVLLLLLLLLAPAATGGRSRSNRPAQSADRRFDAPLIDGEHLAARRPATPALADVLGGKLAAGFLASAVQRAQRRPAKCYFYHVHKGAGTQLLEVVLRLKLGPVLQWTETQHPERALHYHDAAAVEQLQQPGFVSNEFYLDDADRMPWDSYRSFVTTARHPVERSLSHFLHVLTIAEQRMARADFAAWLDRQPDNFYVRRFCGLSCRRVPRGQLNLTHLDLALDNLYRFDVVIDIDHFEQGVAVMQHVLCTAPAADCAPLRLAAPTRSAVDRHSFIAELTPAELDLANHLSALDLLFYNHALFIAHTLITELSIHLMQNSEL